MLKVELHSHTADDPYDRIPYTTRELIDRAAQLGYDALAVTLHDRQLDIQRLESYAVERGITLIPGIERSIQGKHVLLLNFRRGAEEVHSFDDLARLRQRAGACRRAARFFSTSQLSSWIAGQARRTVRRGRVQRDVYVDGELQ